ncbi:MAG: hypothetical protein IJ301_04215 [Clostridia bacterium]|nr:hypothetical protein [Clostridia bacterium]
MNIENLVNFDANDFFIADISEVEYENQRVFFNIIREQFTELNQKEDILPQDVFVREYARKIMDVIEMAAGGCVPAQDFLCYIYKRGIDGLMPSNLVRAHEWGILAVSNGSKLSIERLRLFYESMFDYVADSGTIESILIKNKLNEDNIADFVAQNYSILLLEEMKIDLLTVAKKVLVDDENFIRFNYDAEQANKKVLPKLLELIA